MTQTALLYLHPLQNGGRSKIVKVSGSIQLKTQEVAVFSLKNIFRAAY